MYKWHYLQAKVMQYIKVMNLEPAMSISTVTQKFQTTVPKDVREASGVGAGAILK
jgi:hypothetical protein